MLTDIVGLYVVGSPSVLDRSLAVSIGRTPPKRVRRRPVRLDKMNKLHEHIQ
jgi:hypothetical protein